MKKRFMKRFGALFMALILVFSMAVSASAADSDFTIENGVLIKYNGSGGNVVIPDGVTIVASHAFSGSSLTSVTIPDSVATIRSYAFSGCTSLKSIAIPDSVTGIWDYAFSNCSSLTSITIPDSVISIGDYAFSNCSSLMSVTIPDNLTSISLFTFENCSSLTSVTIPGSVTGIANGAFIGCSSLTNVTIPDSVTFIGASAFNGCSSLTSITIPDSVTIIGNIAFSGSGLTSITIPGSVTGIVPFAFSDCSSLTNVTISDGVTGIGMNAFSGCTSLKSITIPASVTEFDNDIFAVSENNHSTLPVTIYGAAGSAAENYAKANGIKFAAGEAPAAQPSAPSTPSAPLAYASTQTVQIDSRPVQFQMYALKDAKGNPTNYVRVRDVAQILNGTAAQFNVTWDGSVNLVPKTAYVPPKNADTKAPFSGNRAYKKPTSGTKVNGTVTNLDAFVLTDDNGGGHTYYKLRDLGEKLGFNVGWSKERGIYIETDKPYQS